MSALSSPQQQATKLLASKLPLHITIHKPHCSRLQLALMDTITSMVAERSVVVFSKTSSCMSHTIKSLISSYGANPTVYELDELANGQAIERALVQHFQCQPSVPAVFIGQQFIGGADQIMNLQVTNQLVPRLIRANAIWVWNRT